jgi:hypothetical protein
VKVIGHKDEGVKMEAAFRALFLEYVEHQQSIVFHLKETSSVCSCCGNEVRAEMLRGQMHVEIIAERRG